MKNTSTFLFLQSIQKYIWMLLVCFSLSSCTVKDALFEQLGLTVEKPLNKSKTVSSCQFTPLQEKQQSAVEIQKKSTFEFYSSLDFTSTSTQVFKSIPLGGVKNNSPPFYILYQRLKIAVVA
ncbi:MAG TPA: hypothetical protein VIG94_09800 [Faecalibacter sp.]